MKISTLLFPQTGSGLLVRYHADRRATPLEATREGRAVRGFSLVELMAVIALMMVLMAAGVPALRGWRDAQTASAASGQILSMLKEARAMAITQGRPSYVVVSDHSSPADGAIDPAEEAATWRAIAIYQQQEDPALPPRQATRWYRLPEGCHLIDSTEYPSFLQARDAEGALRFPRSGEEKPEALPYLAFNEAGGVLHPARSEQAQLWLRTAPEAHPGQVTVALFTGRPSCVW